MGVGIVMDPTFTFLNLLKCSRRRLLGESVLVNSLRDRQISDVDAVFIGGGFPEVHAERLEKNKPFRVLLDYIKRGGKLYAECSGLMYLTYSRQVGTWIVDAVDAVTVLLEKPVGKGYIWKKVVTPTPITPVGAESKGHERYYSNFREKPTLTIKLEREGRRRRQAGLRCQNNLHAQHLYIHPYTYNVLRTLCRYT